MGKLNEIHHLVLNQFAKNMKMLVNLIIFIAMVAVFASVKKDNQIFRIVLFMQYYSGFNLIPFF